MSLYSVGANSFALGTELFRTRDENGVAIIFYSEAISGAQGE